MHLLIIPKRRDRLTQLRGATAEHHLLLGQLLATAAMLARRHNLRGYRLVINDGAEAQQSVYHLHVHLLSGRALRCYVWWGAPSSAVASMRTLEVR